MQTLTSLREFVEDYKHCRSANTSEEVKNYLIARSITRGEISELIEHRANSQLRENITKLNKLALLDHRDTISIKTPDGVVTDINTLKFLEKVG